MNECLFVHPPRKEIWLSQSPQESYLSIIHVIVESTTDDRTFTASVHELNLTFPCLEISLPRSRRVSPNLSTSYSRDHFEQFIPAENRVSPNGQTPAFTHYTYIALSLSSLSYFLSLSLYLSLYLSLSFYTSPNET